MQTAAAVPATDDALQQRRPFSHCPSRLVWFRFGVVIEPCLVGFVGRPINEAGMMIADENRRRVMNAAPYLGNSEKQFAPLQPEHPASPLIRRILQNGCGA